MIAVFKGVFLCILVLFAMHAAPAGDSSAVALPAGTSLTPPLSPPDTLSRAPEFPLTDSSLQPTTIDSVSIQPPQLQEAPGSGKIIDTTAAASRDPTAQPTTADTAVRFSVKDTVASVPQIVREAPGADGVSSDDIKSLDKMVVTATRTQRLISETPASVSVISRAEIEVSSAKDINDLIANKTGVQVRRSVGMGEGVPSDIIMRGIPGALAATRTLILVDGIPTNASGTPFLILNEIPVEIIENVEIVRGPYSSLYGANAFGGVINVVTKKGDGRPGGAGTFETSYPFSVAEAWSDNNPIRKAVKTGARQALWNADVLSSGGNEKMHYLVNGGYRTIGDYVLNDSALIREREKTTRKSIANHDYTDLRLFGKFGVALTDRLSLDLHTRFFDSNLGFGRTHLSADTTDIDILGSKLIVGPQLMYHHSDNCDLRAGGYFRRVTGDYRNEMASTLIKWRSSSIDWQADFQGIFRLGKMNVVTGGLEYLSNTISFGDLINFQTDSTLYSGVGKGISNGGVYFQDELSLPDNFHIVPGVRFDYNSQFGWAVSPKVGVAKGLADMVRLRASVGRAFRAPTHTELYMPPLPIKEAYVLYSNPDLKPEYIWAIDAGCDVMPLPDVKVQIGGFYNRMRDLIGQGIVWDERGINVTHENISDAWSRGLEFEAEWQVRRWINVSGGYVIQQSRNESASAMRRFFIENYDDLYKVSRETDIPLDYIPRHKGSLGLRFNKRFSGVSLSAGIEEQLVGERKYLEFSQIINPLDNRKVNPDDPSSKTISELVLIEKTLPYEIDPNMNVNPPLLTLPPYFRTDIGIRCGIGERFWLAINVQNLFNAEFEESGGTFSPGRLATIKIGIYL